MIKLVENTKSIDIKQFELYYKKDGITFRTNNALTYYSVIFDRQPTNFGGFKYFFRCNHCNSRVTKLYFPNLNCRKCSGLKYKSSVSNRRNAIDKISLKYNALDRKWSKYGLTSYGGLQGIPQRPRCMTRVRYSRYLIEYFNIYQLYSIV